MTDKLMQKNLKYIKDKALKLYLSKKYKDSLSECHKILEINKEDEFAKFYIEKILKKINKNIENAKNLEKKIKVMIVDDSSMMRKILVNLLSENESIEVIKAAKSGKEAIELIPKIKPDVITLDVNMPDMNGLTTLKHIMSIYPTPIIIISSFNKDVLDDTFDCLSYGALDFISKPSKDLPEDIKKNIINKIKKASKVKIEIPKRIRVLRKFCNIEDEILKHKDAKLAVVMGAKEGGLSTYLKILPHLPSNIPCAILVIQYMEKEYFKEFCHYINKNSKVIVKEAVDNEPLKEGVCYFSHGEQYLKISRSNQNYKCSVTSLPEIISQKNVINQLFFSAAENFGIHSIGALLTNSGIDGVEGLKEIKRVRGIAIIQEPLTCLENNAVVISKKEEISFKAVKDVDIAAILWHILKAKLA